VVACTLILLACRKEQVPYFQYSVFPAEKALRAEVIRLDTALFRYPFRISVRDSIVMIMDLHNADHFFHAFTYPEGKHIASFGRRGEAPEEMLSVTAFQFNSLDTIWALDANRMQITRWELTPSTQSAKRNEVISLDQELVRTLDFYAMESGFFVPDYLGEYRYHQINLEGKPEVSMGIIPTNKSYKEAARPALAQAWRSFMDYNPQKEILVMATQLGEVLDIYHLKDSSRVILQGENGEPEFQISRGEGIPTGIMGFSDVKITDHYIYTVFHGQKFKDIIAAHEEGERPEDGGRYIYVFNLDGQPVCKYILDHAIYGIHVDENNGIIWATDVNSDDPILQYKIDRV